MNPHRLTPIQWSRTRRMARPIATVFATAISALTFYASARAQDTLGPSTNPAARVDAVSKERDVSLPEVRKVLRELDSDQLSQRDAAEKRLIEMGPAVVAFLPEISGNTSGEMKIRLQRIRDQLQKSNIQTFFEASQITLAGKMNVADAVAKIAKQSGNSITIENAESLPAMEVELAADKEPFWKVMDRLLTQSKLRINTFSSTEGMSLVPAYGESAIVPAPKPSIDGPFHVGILSTQTTLQFGSALNGQLDLSLLVSWEPRLKPVFIQLPMAKMKAETAEGEELAATNPEAAPEIPLNAAGCSAQIDLQFARPPRSTGKLKKISGEFVVAVPSEKHKFVFEKFANGKRQSEKFGEVTVTLENARRNGSVYEMRILAEFTESQGALDSFRGWILSNRAYLLDARQNRLENVGFQSYAVTSDAVGVAFLFQINGDPNDFTLVYESPGMITRQSVPFEIENVDLP